MNTSATGQSQPFMVRAAVPSDLPDVLRVRQAQEVADNGEPFTTVDQLAAEWATLGDQLADQMWVAVAPDGSVFACAELARLEDVLSPRLWVPPACRDGGIEAALLTRAEERACTIARAENLPNVMLFAQATAAHPTAQHVLSQAGYAVTSLYEKMELALSIPPPSPRAIEGIVIRALAGERDIATVYRADEEAFQDQRGHTPRTLEHWSQRLHLRAETFDPALWRIAWDDNTVAGVALGEVVADVGWVHHLSVRRLWRRRGLGEALMLSALGAFAARGVGAVRLNVDAQSPTNAHQLYRRLGFQVVGGYANYQKMLPVTP